MADKRKMNGNDAVREWPVDGPECKCRTVIKAVVNGEIEWLGKESSVDGMRNGCGSRRWRPGTRRQLVRAWRGVPGGDATGVEVIGWSAMQANAA